MAIPGNILDREYDKFEENPVDGRTDVRVKVTGFDESGSEPLTLRSDATSTANVVYVGYAAVGSASSSSVWRIVRYTITNGDVVGEFADGDVDFDNVWDNRTGLSYS